MNLYEKVKTLAGAEYRKFADVVRSDGQRYGIYPLGNNQKGIWSVTRIDAQKENPYYNPIFKIVFDGGDPEKIKGSAEDLWNSQDIFRFRYFELDGEPYQYLDRDAVFDIEYIESADEAETQEREKEFCLRNFDLFNEYPIRFRLVKAHDNKYLLYVSVHHIISDGWSDGLICKNLIDAYKGKELNAGKYQYARYVLNEKSDRMKEKRKENMAYWKERLAANDGFADLPTSYGRENDRESRSSVITISMKKELADKIKQVTAAISSNLHAVMLSGFAYTIGRYANKDNINFGTTLANRDDINYLGTVGDFASVIILPVDTHIKGTVKEYIDHVKSTLFKGMDHSSVVLSELIGNTDFQRIDGVNPLYQMIFSVHSKKMLSGMGEGAEIVSDGAKISLENIERGNNNDFTLDLAVIALDKDEDGIDIQAEFSEKYFTENRVRCIIDTYFSVLENMLSDIDKNCDEIGLCSEKNDRETDNDYSPIKLFEEAAVDENTISVISAGDNHICLLDEKMRSVPDCFTGKLFFKDSDKWFSTGQSAMIDEYGKLKIDNSASRLIQSGEKIIDTEELAEKLSEKYNITAVKIGSTENNGILAVYYTGSLSSEKRWELYDEYGIDIAYGVKDTEAYDLRSRIAVKNLAEDITLMNDTLGDGYSIIYDDQEGAALLIRSGNNKMPAAEVMDSLSALFRTSDLKTGYCSGSEIEWYNRAKLTETQQKVYNIWKDILGEKASFGIHDKFFEVGGNSITVLKMLLKLNSEFSIEFNIGELFDRATVYKISEYIDSTTADEGSDEIENISF
ncbi:MAG: hypothetical protein GXY08_00865 [Ruminococcus sp.]|nr:hypothetical protein [Ruminococcus sp.]